MTEFIWSMSISFQLLFIIISAVIFFFLGAKSFKYYALYNVFLVVYILSRYDVIYYGFENFLGGIIGKNNAVTFDNVLSFLLQVAFYNFYTIFALYFLDLDKHAKKYFWRVIWILRGLGIFFILLAIFCLLIKDDDLYTNLYIFFYIPVMLSLFVPTIYRAVKYSGAHKNFFLIGASSFVFCALIAFAGSFIPSLNMENPIIFFYIGIIIETLFFSLGLAYKMKLINDEKNKIRSEILKHKHRQQLSRFHGLLQGEEKERKRLAEELHDGIGGDLAAIKYQLACFNIEDATPENSVIVKDVYEIINKSCEQIREISHNLSPSSITTIGLINTLDNYCHKIEKLYKIKFDFILTGESPDLSKTVQTHIYRIIQELINNMVKHSEADQASVEINYDEPILRITVKDNGKGFSPDQVSEGIGLSNINSRIKFLNAKFTKENSDSGSVFVVEININKVPRNE